MKAQLHLNRTPIQLSALDGTVLAGWYWSTNDLPPRGAMLLVHGMAEHIERYQDFAAFLASNGIAVYGFDLRGHGRTGIINGAFGYLSEEGGWDKCVEDIGLWVRHVRRNFPFLPFFLFGHSMGSFMCREYASRYGDSISGIITTGTAGNPGIPGWFGLYLARLMVLLFGPVKPHPVINTVIFKQYSYYVKNPKTEFDWISRDRATVQAYLQDPLCGRMFGSSFYADLVYGLLGLYRKQHLRRLRRDLPILLLGGTSDPVANMGYGTLQAFQTYHRLGMSDVSLRLYEGGRHESVNETNRHEVYRDIMQWLEARLTPFAEDMREAD